MDPLTQGLVGATAAAALAPRRQLRIALLAGFAGGMTADLDVLIRSSEDSLLAIQYHRHFTHALAFIPAGGMLTALVLSVLPPIRKALSFWRLLLFASAGYATSGILDACTSYGTLLYWPFSGDRIAWNNMPIIDPAYTLGLLFLLGWACFRRNKNVVIAAVLLASLYPVFGEFQNRRAEAIVREIAASRDHQPTDITAKPSPLSLLLWRGIYRHGDTYFVDAIHLSYLSGHRIYPGASVPALDLDDAFPGLPSDSILANDLRRFALFSDDYLYFPEPGKPMIGDLRYALLPNSVSPLWGITYDPAQPEEHCRFQTFRDITLQARQAFLNMMFGKDLPPAD